MNDTALDALAIFVALGAWGAHAVVPGRLAGPGTAAPRAVWARAALPLLLGAAVLLLLRARLHPDPFLGAGLIPVGPSPVTTIALVALGTVLLVDLFLAFVHRRLENTGWRVLAVLGVLGMVAWSALEEAARIGSGPVASLGGYLTAIAARCVFALGAGALVFSTSPSSLGRGFALAAPLASLALWLAWPGLLRDDLVAAWDPLTLGSGTLLIAASPFVPPRLRRVTALVGLALLALFLARAGALSEQLGQSGRVPPPLP